MAGKRWGNLSLGWWLFLALCLGGTGCHRESLVCDVNVPRELTKVALPPYVIEAPDLLLIDAVKVVPLPPYRLGAFDVLVVGFQPDSVPEGFPQSLVIQPGDYSIDPEGTIRLGPPYGAVKVAGLTVEEAKAEVEKRLKQVLKKEFADAVRVVVELAQFQGLQQVRGEHLVRPDGTVSLGTYGSVFVTGLTLEQAESVIEAQLSRFLVDPDVTVDVAGYNSKVFYVIFELGNAGQQVVRLPVTGNETVLDALAQLNGLPPFSTRHKIWVARPDATNQGCDQILPVDWRGISKKGQSATNYQLFPRDRLYVHVDTLKRVDDYLLNLITPVERIFGVTLLGDSLIESLRFSNAGLGGLGGGLGGF